MQDNFVVHIVDDDEAVRQSLAFLLSTAGVPVRVYDSATSFLDGLASLQPGCLITDVRMPDMTGIELLQRLKAKSVDLPVIVITGHGDIPLAVEAMKSGAIDFIEKPFAEEAILRAVRVAEGYVKRQGRRSEEETAVAARLQSLSERERQVLDGLVAGNANKTIAYELGISPRTVEVYRANVMTKMQAKSLSELIRMAVAIRLPD
ncbi:MAG: response regulator FixJ [Methyloceanibacter sp.]|jgi:two-component system response regulator FixJ